MFAGFLPNTKSKRKSALRDLAGIPATLILYESPKRITAMLNDAAEVLGQDRPAALCREITKRFEEVRKGSLKELADSCQNDPPRGEIVVLIGQSDSGNISESDIETHLRRALGEMSVRDAADHVSAELNIPRRDAYQMALALNKAGG